MSRSVLLALLALTGCASVKPIIKDLNDVAVEACLAAFGQENPKMTAGEVLREFCAADSDLQPFIDGVLTAKSKAVELRAIEKGAAE
jgi:hypothetical protein